MAFHKNEALATLHSIHFRAYANVAARLADATLSASDIGKVVLQSDTNQYYIIQNHSPATFGSITGSGAGSGGINYIAENNSNATDSVGDWIAYNDADAIPLSRPGGATPGSGGAPTVTITRSLASPLRGTANFLITKTAVNSQGQGVSIPFTIDNVDRSKLLTISFDYVPSANFAAGSDTVDSDIEVYVYDVTNNLVLQAATYKLTTAATFNGTFTGTFQAASNSTSYRLIFHIPTVNALAWTFQFDNVRVGPGVAVPFQTVVTDWQSFVPTGAWTGPNVTYTGNWRRVGDMMEVEEFISLAGAPAGSSTLIINLPTGYTIDTTKLTNLLPGQHPGEGKGHRNSVGQTQLSILYQTPTTLQVVYLKVTSGSDADEFSGINFTTPVIWNANDHFTIRYKVPIVGWTSNITVSNTNTDASIVTAKATYSGAPFSIATSDTKIQVDATQFDTHGIVNTALERFTIPVSGYYRVTGFLRLDMASDSSKRIIIDLYKGVAGGAPAYLETVTRTGMRAPLDGTQMEPRWDTEFLFNAGDTFEIHATMVFGGATNCSAAEIAMVRVPASAVILPTADPLPAGLVFPFAGATTPSGYLSCDGSAVSRVTFGRLFSAIGITHGQGDGSTTFNIPDYRGRFLRGTDGAAGRDPNSGTRTAMGTGGNVGNNVGSLQAQATAKNGLGLTDPGHTHSTSVGLLFNSNAGAGGSTTLINYGAVGSSPVIAVATTGMSLTAGDAETRPINAYVNYIIKI